MMRIINIKGNIKHLIRLVLSVIWLIVLSALPPAFAVQKPSTPAPDDLILEMAVHGEHISREHVSSAGVTWAEFFEFKRLTNWRRPPDQTSDVGAIHMDFLRQGDAVKIDVVVIFGQIDLSGRQPVGRDRVKSAGDYVIRLGEAASLEGLARFGIEPIQVKVVSAKSHTLNHADIVNKTKAIEVVRVDWATDICLVMLKNISAKNIVGLQINYPGASTRTRKLIAPGQVFEDLININESFLRPPPSKAPGVLEQPKIIVSSVLFEDSTFEGDLEPALIFMAERRGSKIQAVRIVDLLKAAIENPEPDSRRMLEMLRQQLSALSSVADIQMIDDLAARFGPFTTYQRNGLLGALRDGLSDTKQAMLERLRLYEAREALKGISLQSWLSTVKGEYEERIKKP
jgi:hypothetical protein